MSGAARTDAIPPLVFIKTCLAQAANEPPSGDEWAHEIKFDGYRIQAHVAKSKASILTRNALDWTEKFGSVVGELQKLRVRSAIIDGEAVVQNEAGVADFDALRREFERGRNARIVLMAFDLLHLDGVDLRQRPLLERTITISNHARSYLAIRWPITWRLWLGPRWPGPINYRISRNCSPHAA